MLARHWYRLCGHIRRSGGHRTAAPSLTCVCWPPTSQRRRSCHCDPGDLYENESVRRHLRRLVEEHGDAGERLQLASLSETDRKWLVRRHAELQYVADVFGKMEEAQRDLEEVLSLLHGECPAGVHLLYKTCFYFN